MNTSSIETQPYVGLRFFTERDAHLFYGRDEHVAELLAKVAENRFVAVLGSSGSGKSSLVRAGLLPELRSGMIPRAGPRWKIVEFQPGDAPLERLANALNEELRIHNARELVEEGPLGIVRAVAAASLEPKTNVLLIADQFEEVFRMQREQAGLGRGPQAVEECRAFARSLLDAGAEPGWPIYVLLVMRSDYLGECAQFPELPERMSQSLYLVPRLRRDQLQEAIVAPVGGAIEPAVVQRLLAEVGSDPDQLPRLQHLLARMWDRAKGGELEMTHYSSAGGWENALAQHLEEVYGRLSAPERRASARVFPRLSEVDKGRAVRRRADVTELVELCGPNAANVASAFRADGFLARQPNPVDITHECILREWPRLSRWLEREQLNAKRLRELTEAANDAGWRVDLEPQEQELIRGLEGLTLRNLVNWRNEAQPTAAWAGRYLPAADFLNADSYLTFSEARHQAREARALWQRRVILCVFAALFVGLGLSSWKFYQQKFEALRQTAVAVKAQTEAEQSVAALNEFRHQVLRQNGWTEERIQSAAPNNDLITRSLEANKDLLDLPSKATPLTIYYYPKPADPTEAIEVLKRYWRSFGYDPEVGVAKNPAPTNALFYRGPLLVLDLQRIALSLIRAGIELHAIKPLDTPGTTEVVIGYFIEFDPHPRWTPKEIMSTTQFNSPRTGIDKAYLAIGKKSDEIWAKAAAFLSARSIGYTPTHVQNRYTLITPLLSKTYAAQLETEMQRAGIPCEIRYP